METMVLIPARGGSKRVFRKNIRMLWGKPLLVYTIETALESRCIDRVICTTDDPEIAEIARRHGAEVPFIRPAELAGDKSADVEFYFHALEWLEINEGYRPDIIGNLRPTTPLRQAEVIDRVIETLISRPDVDSIRTVHPSPLSVFMMRTISEASGLIECPVLVPREGPHGIAKQPLPKTYMLNAYFDATWVTAVQRTRSSLGIRSLPYVLEEQPIDIDTEEDWQRLLDMYSSFDDYKKRP